MVFRFIDDLAAGLAGAFPGVERGDILEALKPEIPPPDIDSDLAVNCFKLAKPLRTAPPKIAAVAAELLAAHPDVAAVATVNAFVNVTLKPAALHRDTTARPAALLAAATLPEANRKRIMVEYSAPNTNKPQHLGHVRNNTIGMSLAALLARVGHEVVPINLINDRGVHICKSMIAYQRFGDGATPESTGVKGDHLVGRFYVRFNEELSRQLAELRRERPELASRDDDELFLETEIGRATQDMLKAWEADEREVRELWRTMNSWVLAGFDDTYRRMGARFRQVYLESDTYLLGKDIVARGLEAGVFERRADGAITVDLGKQGAKVVLRSDGTSVYITQDLGTTVKKYQDFQPDTQIWVVGDEQILHFQQLFAILGKLGYEWAAELHHLAYGMVNLPSGKMKSREGTVVDADELFDNMVGLAREATLERCGGEAPPDLDSRAEAIGMGALKFMLLKFSAKSSIMFDPAAAIKFEGDTGPYVQYACARINSIVRKAAERGLDAGAPGESVNLGLLGSPEERRLAVRMSFYPEILRLAAERLDSSGLAGYLLDLAKDFNRFYRECPVLAAADAEVRQARAALCAAARDIIVDGLATMTISVPEAM